MGRRGWVLLLGLVGTGSWATGCQPSNVDAARGALEGSASTVGSVVAIADTVEGVACSAVAIGPSEIVTATPCITDSRDTPSNFRVYPDGFAGGSAPGLEVAEVVVDTTFPGVGTTGSFSLSVLRTTTAHGIPVATRASTPPAIDDAVTLAGFGNAIGDPDIGETRREAAAVIIALDHLPPVSGVTLETFETAPPAVCDGDGGGGVFAADGSLVGVIQGGPDPCDGTPPAPGDGDNIIDVTAHAAFLDGVLAPRPDGGPGDVDAGATDAGTTDPGIDGGTDAGAAADAGPEPSTDSGCGCRSVRPAVHASPSMLGLMLLGLLLMRRRMR